MRIISFNVNSIRTRLHQLDEVVKRHNPDIIGLQETKVCDEDFPLEVAHQLGYEAEFFGQKTHYGVAILSKIPFANCKKGFSEDDDQRRVICADFTAENGETLSVINAYFPQGDSRDHAKKFPYKQAFYEKIQTLLTDNFTPASNLVLMGDLNVSPDDNDILFDDKERLRWLKSGKCSFLPEERSWINKLMSWGLYDSYRLQYPQRADQASWFDYRTRGFNRSPKRGLRIDFVLCSDSLRSRCNQAGIDYDIRAMERPSDHCPVWADFDL